METITRRASTFSASLVLIMPPQPVCIVIFLSGQIFLWIFCYSVGVGKKITKVGADEMIDAEMKSLSTLHYTGNDVLNLFL
jgi:hypothetical protein